MAVRVLVDDLGLGAPLDEDRRVLRYDILYEKKMKCLLDFSLGLLVFHDS